MVGSSSSKPYTMTQELKNDIITSLTNVNDAIESLWKLSADDLLDYRFAMAEDLSRVIDLLGKYAPDEVTVYQAKKDIQEIMDTKYKTQFNFHNWVTPPELAMLGITRTRYPTSSSSKPPVMEYLLSVYKNDSLFFDTKVLRRRDAYRVWNALQSRFNDNGFSVRLELIQTKVQPAEFILNEETQELTLDYLIS